MNQPTPFSPPASGDYNEYYRTYVSKFTPQDYLKGMELQITELNDLLGDLPAGEDSIHHSPYTWTLKQVVGHLIDAERIFSTRALRIAVADKTPNPSMDQDIYVDNLNYEDVTMRDLLLEFEHLRRSNILMASRMTSENLAESGTASDFPITANANFYILGGHVAYHLEIMRNRLGASHPVG